jgi:putative oxidoreductase
MNTLTHTRPHLPYDVTQAKSKLLVVPIGRFLFSLIFIISGINHLSGGAIAYAASAGVPFADILVPLSGIMAFLGGISIALGWHARIGALLLFAFLVPITFFMHNFWIYSDQMMMQNQMAHFMKNLCLIGGTMLFAFYGAGPISIDNQLAKKH